MTSGSEFLIGPTSDYETWRTGLRSVGVFSSQDLESKVFEGSIRGSRLRGLLRSKLHLQAAASVENIPLSIWLHASCSLRSTYFRQCVDARHLQAERDRMKNALQRSLGPRPRPAHRSRPYSCPCRQTLEVYRREPTSITRIRSTSRRPSVRVAS